MPAGTTNTACGFLGTRLGLSPFPSEGHPARPNSTPRSASHTSPLQASRPRALVPCRLCIIMHPLPALIVVRGLRSGKGQRTHFRANHDPGARVTNMLATGSPPGTPFTAVAAAHHAKASSRMSWFEALDHQGQRLGELRRVVQHPPGMRRCNGMLLRGRSGTGSKQQNSNGINASTSACHGCCVA